MNKDAKSHKGLGILIKQLEIAVLVCVGARWLALAPMTPTPQAWILGIKEPDGRDPAALSCGVFPAQ